MTTLLTILVVWCVVLPAVIVGGATFVTRDRGQRR